MRRATIWILFAASALAQPPAFVAATIKPSQDAPGHSGWHSNPGIMFLQGQTLKRLIGIAYHVKDAQVTGGPKWMDGERFDVNAKADGPLDEPDMLPMLQSLLADRFRLSFHHEEKIASTYVLVVAKSGLKIKPVEGSEGSRSNSSKGSITSQGVTMVKFADQLTRRMGAPVTDMTGMTGVFNIALEWSTEGDAAEIQSALLSALQQKLGLKLEMRKLPLDLLVIDRAEKPSEN